MEIFWRRENANVVPLTYRLKLKCCSVELATQDLNIEQRIGYFRKSPCFFINKRHYVDSVGSG